jgi:hypothetical protein
MNVIYFDKDCEINAKEYAEQARTQAMANKVNAAIEKAAVCLCFVTSIVAASILIVLCLT